MIRKTTPISKLLFFLFSIVFLVTSCKEVNKDTPDLNCH